MTQRSLSNIMEFRRFLFFLAESKALFTSPRKTYRLAARSSALHRVFHALGRLPSERR